MDSIYSVDYLIERKKRMIIKERTKSVTTHVMESLYCRGRLDEKRQKEYRNAIKGLEGERRFDEVVASTVTNGYVLNDLMLKDGTSLSQIDSLIVTENSVHIFEIKNYTGEYTYKEEEMHSPYGFIIPSPTTQITNSRSLVHNIMRKTRLKLPIEAHVVFVNPAFYLYDLPINKPFIFNYQLEKHLRGLNRGEVNTTHKQEKIVQHLLNHHVENYRPNDLPKYILEELKKGVHCPECLSFNHTVKRLYKLCDCGHKEEITEAIERSIKEFQILFPEKRVTVSALYDWCGGTINRKKILEHLKRNYRMNGTSRGIYYN